LGQPPSLWKVVSVPFCFDDDDDDEEDDDDDVPFVNGCCTQGYQFQSHSQQGYHDGCV